MYICVCICVCMCMFVCECERVSCNIIIFIFQICYKIYIFILSITFLINRFKGMNNYIKFNKIKNSIISEL